MTGTEIQSYVESRIGRQVDSDDVLEAINEGLNEIGDMGLLYATIDVSVSDTSQWYNMPVEPAPYTQIIHIIKKENNKEYYYQRWEYRNGSIRFFDEGDYTIVARKMPEHLNNISDSFTSLHRLYYNAIKFYALSWIRENDDIEDTGAQLLRQRFEESVARAATTLVSTKSPAKVKVIRHA